MTEEKELIDSTWQAARICGYTILYALAAKKGFGVSNPSTKMDVADAGKLMVCVTAAMVTDNYALKKGWYKDKISS